MNLHVSTLNKLYDRMDELSALHGMLRRIDTDDGGTDAAALLSAINLMEEAVRKLIRTEIHREAEEGE